MSDLIQSLLRKLKTKPETNSVPSTEPDLDSRGPDSAESLPAEAELAGLDDADLQKLLAEQPEARLVPLLASIEDPTFQLRVLQNIAGESALKRIVRSQLPKKLKRAAEARLQDTGSAGLKRRFERLAELSTQMESFIQKPKADAVEELLAAASDPGLDEERADRDSPVRTHFLTLRNRIKQWAENHAKAIAELEKLCLELETDLQPPRPVEAARQARWRELVSKYSISPDAPLLERYAEIMAARRRPKPAMEEPAPASTTTPAGPVPDPMAEEKRAQKAAAREQSAKAARERRFAAIEKLRQRILEVDKNLTHPMASPELRRIRGEAGVLQREARKEFPTQLADMEQALKDVTARQTQASDEARWDTWARTDLAVRIKTQLEETLTAIEADSEPDTALLKAIGLTAQLHEYAKEMRALGTLERGKDHQIWKEFKSLSDRGYAVCDRMRKILFERLQTVVTAHAAHPVEFTSAALAKRKDTLHFKDTAFADEIADQLKTLRSVWLEVGGKPSKEGRELETVFTKIHEAYSRQFNIKRGRVQRAELSVLQLKKELLTEMKIASESKATLTARTRTALNLAERWEKSALPPSGAEELQAEFLGYRDRITADVAEEFRRHTEHVVRQVATATENLAQLSTKSGAALPQLLQAAKALETDLGAMEKYLAPLRGWDAAQETAFQEARTRGLALIQECKSAATREARDRAAERIRIVTEAEKLAVVADLEASRARFEELQQLWTSAGSAGPAQDPKLELLFGNIRAFITARLARKDVTPDAAKDAKGVTERKNILFALEALTRFRKALPGEKALPPLPFTETELKTEASRGLLNAGLKYKQILSMDPTGGVAKETRKLMEQWARLAPGPGPDETLAAHWAGYLLRVRLLLDIT